MKYLIWSIEHSAWWKPHELGYTGARYDAGRYELKDAERICESANQLAVNVPNEAIVPDYEIYEIYETH